MKSQSELNLSIALSRITTAEAFDTVLNHINTNQRSLTDEFSKITIGMIQLFCLCERDRLISLCGEELQRFKDLQARLREQEQSTKHTNNIVVTFR